MHCSKTNKQSFAAPQVYDITGGTIGNSTVFNRPRVARAVVQAPSFYTVYETMKGAQRWRQVEVTSLKLISDLPLMMTSSLLGNTEMVKYHVNITVLCTLVGDDYVMHMVQF